MARDIAIPLPTTVNIDPKSDVHFPIFKMKSKKEILKNALLKSKSAGVGKKVGKVSGETPSIKEINVEPKDKTPAKPKGKTVEKSKLQEKMVKKLAGSKFRWLNERLYTIESQDAFDMFQTQPELFEIYHHGFAAQVQDWPVNPVDLMIEYLEKKPKGTVVADMGCGDAKIAQILHKKLTIHSFDLYSGNEFITACDIANVPLEAKTVDVVVFSLSLMGTNFYDFLLEAKRILVVG
jgi:hypothetical protein